MRTGRYKNTMSWDEVKTAMDEEFENEIDSDSEETKTELLKGISQESKFIAHPELKGLVCKRKSGAVATLRVSMEVCWFSISPKINVSCPESILTNFIFV